MSYQFDALDAGRLRIVQSLGATELRMELVEKLPEASPRPATATTGSPGARVVALSSIPTWLGGMEGTWSGPVGGAVVDMNGPERVMSPFITERKQLWENAQI